MCPQFGRAQDACSQRLNIRFPFASLSILTDINTTAVIFECAKRNTTSSVRLNLTRTNQTRQRFAVGVGGGRAGVGRPVGVGCSRRLWRNVAITSARKNAKTDKRIVQYNGKTSRFIWCVQAGWHVTWRRRLLSNDLQVFIVWGYSDLDKHCRLQSRCYFATWACNSWPTNFKHPAFRWSLQHINF